MMTEKKQVPPITLKNYIWLHLAVMAFSFTSVFAKLASAEFNRSGIFHWKFLLFVFLMFMDCFLYALVWQKVIKGFALNVAYAHKTVYLLWSQLWAVLIFHEVLTVKNIIGLVIVFIGVMVVQRNE